jgi:hypothetical protein
MVETKRSKASRTKNMSKDLGREYSQIRGISTGQLAELGGGKVAYCQKALSCSRCMPRTAPRLR